jgi:Xaa-Pro aminopeptidase
MYFITDWVKRIDFDRMRDIRLKTLREKMIKNGLDVLLSLRPENIRYITGLHPNWFPYVQFRNLSILTKEGDPLLFIDEGDYLHRKKVMYWLPPQNIFPLPILEIPELLRGTLKIIREKLSEMAVSEKRIGVDLLNMDILEGIRQILPKAQIIDGDECVKEARMIKNEEEIKALRVSSICVEMGFHSAIKAIKPGRRECEILGEASRTFTSLGMEVAQCQSIVASGEENLSPLARFATDKMIQNGELVFMDMGGCFNGMFAEATRTVVCGKPHPKQKDIYKIVYEALQEVVCHMKPGKTSEEAHNAQLKVYQKYDMEKFAHLTLLGHSIGLGGSEPPNFGDPTISGNVFEFKPGMVFSVEPTLIVPGVPGGGGVRIEDEILITETGNEILTKIPYDEMLLS